MDTEHSLKRQIRQFFRKLGGLPDSGPLQMIVEGETLWIVDGESRTPKQCEDVLRVSVFTLFHQYYDARVILDFGEDALYEFTPIDDSDQEIVNWLRDKCGFDVNPIRRAGLEFVDQPVFLQRTNPE